MSYIYFISGSASLSLILPLLLFLTLKNPSPLSPHSSYFSTLLYFSPFTNFPLSSFLFPSYKNSSLTTLPHHHPDLIPTRITQSIIQSKIHRTRITMLRPKPSHKIQNRMSYTGSGIVRAVYKGRCLFHHSSRRCR